MHVVGLVEASSEDVSQVGTRRPRLHCEGRLYEPSAHLQSVTVAQDLRYVVVLREESQLYSSAKPIRQPATRPQLGNGKVQLTVTQNDLKNDRKIARKIRPSLSMFWLTHLWLSPGTQEDGEAEYDCQTCRRVACNLPAVVVRADGA
jgi:hypothetical protein